jgi:hypothetical protein
VRDREFCQISVGVLRGRKAPAFPVTRVGKLDKAALRKAIAEKVAADKDR